MPSDDPKDKDAGARTRTDRIADRFESLGEVSLGGIGRIETAYDPVIGRRIAIKTLKSDLPEGDRAALKFAEEAQITGQLEHPNIVPIYDLGGEANAPFIAMKFIRGRTLAALLSDGEGQPRPFETLQRFVEIVLRLCDALAYAHSRGVIHCDVKPDNVMVGDYGQVYLMDWGVALLKSRRRSGAAIEGAVESTRLSREQLAASDLDSLVRVASSDEEGSTIRGTPAYMAPEQLRGRTDEIDERTDVFGLGGVLYEILTGKPPNDWGRVLSLAGKHEPLTMPKDSPSWPRLPPELCRIALKALAPSPDERYADVGALKRDLEQFLRGGGWFETRSFCAGESVVVEGDPGDAAYIIEQGECAVVKLLNGEPTVLRRLGPGDVFGETAVLTGAPRTASVVALSDLRVKVITGDSLNSELDRNPWLAAFVRSLAVLFREADARRSRSDG